MVYERTEYACDAALLAEALGAGLPRDTVVLRAREALADSGFLKDGDYVLGALSMGFERALDSVQVRGTMRPDVCEQR